MTAQFALIPFPAVFLFVCTTSLAPSLLWGQAFPAFNERHRDWTSAQGTVFRSRLIAVNDASVKLYRKGVIKQVPMSALSPKYQKIARSHIPEDFGTISHYSVEPQRQQQRDFLETHRIESLVWEGPVGPGLADRGHMPFLFFTPPDRKPGEQLPILIHLHGTGGYGTDNLKPLFSCAGGIARTYFDKRLQSSERFCVMIPQFTPETRVYTSDLIGPPPSARWLTCAVHLLGSRQDSPIDPKRVYLIGLSLGGHGVTELLGKYPDFYCAGIAVSGFGGIGVFQENRRAVRDQNLWIVVNRHDQPGTREIVRAFSEEYGELGGKMRVSVENTDGHNAWSQFIGKKEFRTWLFRQRLQGW